MTTPSKRKTPAAKALVGCLALNAGNAVWASFHFAGYRVQPVCGPAMTRGVFRGERMVHRFEHGCEAALWLSRLGSKLEALRARKAAT